MSNSDLPEKQTIASSEMEDIRLRSVDDPVDELIGSTVADKYEIEELLGKGAMGSVYKVRHKMLNKTLALKVLNHASSSQATAQQRFQREAQSASQLAHKNLVTVHDYGETADGRLFFTMDYVEGESLSTLIKQGPLPPARALDIAKQVCLGLAHAHGKGIIHRDLKPSNIIIIHNEEGEDIVKIVDFGIAKLDTADANSLTQTGEIFGTPLYMSPEQCSGFSVDGRSDLYSLGCVLYESLTGSPPFKGDSALSTAVHHLQSKTPELALLLPDQSLLSSLNTLIHRAMEKDRQNRFQSADEFRNSIEEVQKGEVIAGGVKANRKSNGHVPRNYLLPVVTSIILIAVFAVAAVQFINPGSQAPKKPVTAQEVENAIDEAVGLSKSGNVRDLQKAVAIYEVAFPLAVKNWKGQSGRIKHIAYSYWSDLMLAYQPVQKISDKMLVADTILDNSPPDSSEYAQGLTFQAIVKVQSGEMEEARKVYLQAAKLRNSLNDQIGSLRDRRYYASSYMWQSNQDFQTAEREISKVFEQAKELIKSNPTPEMKSEYAMIAGELGFAKVRQKKMSEAKELFMIAAKSPDCPDAFLKDGMLNGWCKPFLPAEDALAIEKAIASRK